MISVLSVLKKEKKMDEPSYTDDEVPTKKKETRAALLKRLGRAKWWQALWSMDWAGQSGGIALRGEPSN